MLIGLRRLNDACHVGNSSILGGYVLGEIILSRSSLTADIYFIYVRDKWRGFGNGVKLYRCFENAVKERTASVGVKITILIRIPMRHCIVNSIRFWRKLGFEGFEDSICLIKTIKPN
jgi:GNAT superfamily N-acetyltransferase